MPEHTSTPCDRHDQRLSDHDLRILSLETHAKVAENQLNALTASSHEKANWLNRHNLEINELKLKVVSVEHTSAALTGKYDGLDTELTTLQLTFTQQIGQLRSDIKQNAVIVAGIVGLIVAGGRAILDKLF